MWERGKRHSDWALGVDEVKLSISENKDPDPNMGFWGTRAGGIPRDLVMAFLGEGCSHRRLDLNYLLRRV